MNNYLPNPPMKVPAKVPDKKVDYHSKFPPFIGLALVGAFIGLSLLAISRVSGWIIAANNVSSPAELAFPSGDVALGTSSIAVLVGMALLVVLVWLIFQLKVLVANKYNKSGSLRYLAVANFVFVVGLAVLLSMYGSAGVSNGMLGAFVHQLVLGLSSLWLVYYVCQYIQKASIVLRKYENIAIGLLFWTLFAVVSLSSLALVGWRINQKNELAPLQMSQDQSPIPRIALRPNFLPMYFDVEDLAWKADTSTTLRPDTDIRWPDQRVEYCQKWYPETTRIEAYGTETVSGWIQYVQFINNFPNPNALVSVSTLQCVQGSESAPSAQRSGLVPGATEAGPAPKAGESSEFVTPPLETQGLVVEPIPPPADNYPVSDSGGLLLYQRRKQAGLGLIPRLALHGDLIAMYLNLDTTDWEPHPQWLKGNEVTDPLEFCRLVYPETVAVRDYKYEIIYFAYDLEQPEKRHYERPVTIECVQE